VPCTKLRMLKCSSFWVTSTLDPQLELRSWNPLEDFRPQTLHFRPLAKNYQTQHYRNCVRVAAYVRQTSLRCRWQTRATQRFSAC